MTTRTIKAYDDLNGVTWGTTARIGETDIAWIGGFNFRATDVYVTDGANETYVLGSSDASFPFTRAGFEIGYTNASNVNSRNRNNGLDRRLAGINYFGVLATQYRTFHITLPSVGTYLMELAMGDTDNSTQCSFQVFDDTSSLYTVSNTSVLTNQSMDANANVFTDANWPSSQTTKSLTFSTTVFKILFGDGTEISPVRHLKLTKQ